MVLYTIHQSRTCICILTCCHHLLCLCSINNLLTYLRSPGWSYCNNEDHVQHMLWFSVYTFLNQHSTDFSISSILIFTACPPPEFCHQNHMIANNLLCENNMNCVNGMITTDGWDANCENQFHFLYFRERKWKKFQSCCSTWQFRREERKVYKYCLRWVFHLSLVVLIYFQKQSCNTLDYSLESTA